MNTYKTYILNVGKLTLETDYSFGIGDITSLTFECDKNIYNQEKVTLKGLVNEAFIKDFFLKIETFDAMTFEYLF